MTSYSLAALMRHKRDFSTDEFVKDMMRSTRLSAQFPEKSGTRENYICEIATPGTVNLTGFCADSTPSSAASTPSSAAEKIEQHITETPSKSTDTNQPQKSADSNENSPQIAKAPNKLEQIYQALYVAQAQVQLEVKQIQRAQSLAAAQQKALEEASMNVRTITGALHAAQQDVATAAMRAQTAQLQLAAHDQLLFAARQKVDALSSRAVGLQAEDSIVLPKLAIDIQDLLGKLKAPLPENLRPTAIPAMCQEMEAKMQLIPQIDYNQSSNVHPNQSVAINSNKSSTINPNQSATINANQAATNCSNQSTPLTSKDQRARDLEKAIRDIITKGRYKKSARKRSSAVYEIHDNNIKEKEDLRRSAQYDNYFYRWFVKDVRNERRKRRLKKCRKKNKRNYDYYVID